MEIGRNEDQAEKSEGLFLIMSSKNENRFSLYRVCEPGSALDIGDEMSVRNLDEPLFEMNRSVFSRGVSFAAVGSRIFIVGGSSYDNEQKVQPSDNVFIYDTETLTLSRGPPLNYGKRSPHLFTLGSKLFALSFMLDSVDRNSSSSERKILFEVLDTSNIECGWCTLPNPTLKVSENPRPKHIVTALVAMVLDGGSSLGVVFLSVGECGTYVFDIGKQIWEFVSADALPFSGHGSPIPDTLSLCCGISIKARAFSSFRFCYNGDEDETTKRFQIHEAKIHDPFSLSPPLPPYIFPRPVKLVQGVGGRLYLVGSGVDRPNVANTLEGNRYVKISAYEFSNLKVAKEEVVTQLELTGLWRMSIFGGPVCDPLLHVKAAFAM